MPSPWSRSIALDGEAPAVVTWLRPAATCSQFQRACRAQRRAQHGAQRGVHRLQPPGRRRAAVRQRPEQRAAAEGPAEGALQARAPRSVPRPPGSAGKQAEPLAVLLCSGCSNATACACRSATAAAASLPVLLCVGLNTQNPKTLKLEALKPQAPKPWNPSSRSLRSAGGQHGFLQDAARVPGIGQAGPWRAPCALAPELSPWQTRHLRRLWQGPGIEENLKGWCKLGLKTLLGLYAFIPKTLNSRERRGWGGRWDMQRSPRTACMATRWEC